MFWATRFCCLNIQKPCLTLTLFQGLRIDAKKKRIRQNHITGVEEGLKQERHKRFQRHYLGHRKNISERKGQKF